VPGLVAFYDIRPGDGVGLFSAPEPVRGGMYNTNISSHHRNKTVNESQSESRRYYKQHLSQQSGFGYPLPMWGFKPIIRQNLKFFLKNKSAFWCRFGGKQIKVNLGADFKGGVRDT